MIIFISLVLSKLKESKNSSYILSVRLSIIFTSSKSNTKYYKYGNVLYITQLWVVTLEYLYDIFTKSPLKRLA